MNYRHDYHAGNFADVMKHVVLARILTYLKLKPRPFRVIDTHAGAGHYDLAGPEAARTGEWRDGIARLFDANLSVSAADLLAPYLDAVRAVNAPGELKYYPGSPLIARFLMRPDDVLIANELNAADFVRLKNVVRRFRSTSALNIDAWHAVKSLLPPAERRGIVLIDPPFEEKNEFADVAAALSEANARFASGVYLIWYPLKDDAAADCFRDEVIARSRLEFLDVRLTVCRPFAGLGLTAAGLLVLNPPYVLREELEVIAPVLRDLLQQGAGNGYQLRDAVH
jgi:23S rRNA (adenine2030-N6)-methyltransferase